jgi:hypothetical protein
MMFVTSHGSQDNMSLHMAPFLIRAAPDPAVVAPAAAAGVVSLLVAFFNFPMLIHLVQVFLHLRLAFSLA